MIFPAFAKPLWLFWGFSSQRTVSHNQMVTLQKYRKNDDLMVLNP
jgi:hypothetical protein